MQKFKLTYEAGGTYTEKGSFEIEAESKEAAIQILKDWRENDQLGDLRRDYEEADYEIY